MKSLIDRLNIKQKNSLDAYKKTLDKKIKMAKDTNSRMDSVARRAKQLQEKKME